MNAKKAKALRAAVRAAKMDPKDTVCIKTKMHNVHAYTIDLKTGEDVIAATVSAHTEVLADCGKKLYKQLKKVAS